MWCNKCQAACEPFVAAVAPTNVTCWQHQCHCDCPAGTWGLQRNIPQWRGATGPGQSVPVSSYIYIPCRHSATTGNDDSKLILLAAHNLEKSSEWNQLLFIGFKHFLLFNTSFYEILHFEKRWFIFLLNNSPMFMVPAATPRWRLYLCHVWAVPCSGATGWTIWKQQFLPHDSVGPF